MLIAEIGMLIIAVFLTGACVLVLEITATRILSPYFGNTIFTVSSVITVILAALSAGYVAGGRLADRNPSPQWFFRIILVSGLVVLAMDLSSALLLPLLSYALSFSVGPLFSSLILFFLPAFLLGMLSPYAIKLESIRAPQKGIGSVSGTIFFVSTVGSIVGSLLSGFVLIPLFGVHAILVGTGVTLFVLGLVPLLLSERRHIAVFLLMLLFFIEMLLRPPAVLESHALYDQDGIYEKILIYDGTFADRPARFLQQDRSRSGAMFLDTNDPRDLAYDYTKYYALYRLVPTDVNSALVIGGGAYSIPKALLAEFPDARVDVAEVEPRLFALAQQYFRVQPSPRLHAITEDGRRVLEHSEKRYDFIFVDAYASLFSIPIHFTTQEFFAIAKDKLNDNGVLIANIIGDLSEQQPSLVLSEMKTFQSVFPNSAFFAVDSPQTRSSQNIIFVGFKNGTPVDVFSPSIIDDENAVVRSLHEKIIDPTSLLVAQSLLLTDNYAPIEYLTGKVLERTFGDEDLAAQREKNVP